RRLHGEVFLLRGYGRNLCGGRRRLRLHRIVQESANNPSRQQRRRRASSYSQVTKAPREPDHDQSIEQEQRKRRQEYRASQIQRLAVPVGIVFRVEGGNVERRRTVGGRQRVDGNQAFGRAVETRWMIETAALAEIAWNRPCGWRWR